MATVLELSQADKNLVSFMKAIKASGMEDELKAVGPFTFLAPVNLAFGKLSQGDLFETLLKQDGSRLRAILSYHIIKGKKMQRDFRTGQKVQTLGGQELQVTTRDGDIYINNARILAKDRQGSNGVVHCIDSINLPPELKPV
ncbi:MAG TPA: fasciclin domain-containing protein [Chitinophagaceae bacterium]|nr:fasciclin domain-containing protein [Chitinophagaceae bacterium]HPN59759.1 fasciclin domain-containing protein [Chitinophagaceae bacterium]